MIAQIARSLSTTPNLEHPNVTKAKTLAKQNKLRSPRSYCLLDDIKVMHPSVLDKDPVNFTQVLRLVEDLCEYKKHYPNATYPFEGGRYVL